MAEPQANASTNVSFKVDIVVIGAGQAGLSSAYHLGKLGLAVGRQFLVLDSNPTPGGAWQHRWPSLTLSTVNRVHDLPGMQFSEAVDTGDGAVKASVAVPEYFASYERRFNLPVYRPVTVKVVCDRSGRLRIETSRETFSARGIINATGTWETRSFRPMPAQTCSGAGNSTATTIAARRSSRENM